MKIKIKLKYLIKPIYKKLILIFLSLVIAVPTLVFGADWLLKKQYPDEVIKLIIEKTIERKIDYDQLEMGIFSGFTASNFIIFDQDNEVWISSESFNMKYYFWSSLLHQKLVVKKIAMNNSMASLHRDQNGEWDFAYLLEKYRKIEHLINLELINIDMQSTSLYVDDFPTSQKFAFENINSSIEKNDNHHFEASLEKFNDQVVNLFAKGSFEFDFDEKILQKADIEKLELARLNLLDSINLGNVLVDDLQMPIELLQGFVSLNLANLEIDNNQVLIKGNISLEGLQIMDQDENFWQLSDMFSEFDVEIIDNKESISIGLNKIDFKYEDIPVLFSGKLDVSAKNIRYAVNIISSLDLNKIQKYVPEKYESYVNRAELAGMIDLNVLLSGFNDDFDISVKSGLNDIYYESLHSSAESDVCDDEIMTIISLIPAIQQLNGKIDFRDNSLVITGLKGEIMDIVIEDFNASVQDFVNPIVKVDVKVGPTDLQLIKNNLAMIDAEAVRNLDFATLLGESGSTFFVENDMQSLLTLPEFDFADIIAENNLTFINENDLQNFSLLSDLDFAGLIGGSGSISFSENILQNFSALVDLDDISLSTSLLPISFQNITGQVSLNQDEVAINNVNIHANGVDLTVNAKVLDYLDRPFVENLDIKSENTSVESLLSIANDTVPVEELQGLSLKGFLKMVDLKTSENFEQYNGQIELDRIDIAHTILPSKFSDFEGKVSFDTDIINIDDVKFQFSDSLFEINGWIADYLQEKIGLDVHMLASTINLEEIANILIQYNSDHDLGYDFLNELIVKGRINGIDLQAYDSLDQLKLDGELFLEDISIELKEESILIENINGSIFFDQDKITGNIAIQWREETFDFGFTIAGFDQDKITGNIEMHWGEETFDFGFTIAGFDQDKITGNILIQWQQEAFDLEFMIENFDQETLSFLLQVDSNYLPLSLIIKALSFVDPDLLLYDLNVGGGLKDMVFNVEVLNKEVENMLGKLDINEVSIGFIDQLALVRHLNAEVNIDKQSISSEDLSFSVDNYPVSVNFKFEDYFDIPQVFVDVRANLMKLDKLNLMLPKNIQEELPGFWIGGFIKALSGNFEMIDNEYKFLFTLNSEEVAINYPQLMPEMIKNLNSTIIIDESSVTIDSLNLNYGKSYLNFFGNIPDYLNEQPEMIPFDLTFQNSSVNLSDLVAMAEYQAIDIPVVDLEGKINFDLKVLNNAGVIQVFGNSFVDNILFEYPDLNLMVDTPQGSMLFIEESEHSSNGNSQDQAIDNTAMIMIDSKGNSRLESIMFKFRTEMESKNVFYWPFLFVDIFTDFSATEKGVSMPSIQGKLFGGDVKAIMDLQYDDQETLHINIDGDLNNGILGEMLAFYFEEFKESTGNLQGNVKVSIAMSDSKEVDGGGNIHIKDAVINMNFFFDILDEIFETLLPNVDLFNYSDQTKKSLKTIYNQQYEQVKVVLQDLFDNILQFEIINVDFAFLEDRIELENILIANQLYWISQIEERDSYIDYDGNLFINCKIQISSSILEKIQIIELKNFLQEQSIPLVITGTLDNPQINLIESLEGFKTINLKNNGTYDLEDLIEQIEHGVTDAEGVVQQIEQEVEVIIDQIEHGVADAESAVEQIEQEVEVIIDQVEQGIADSENNTQQSEEDMEALIDAIQQGISESEVNMQQSEEDMEALMDEILNNIIEWENLFK